MIASIILITIVTYLLYVIKRICDIQRKFDTDLGRLPAPDRRFFFGNALEMIKPTEILNTLYKYQLDYKSNFVIRVGPTRYILFCTDLKFLEFLLPSQKFLRKSMDYRFIHNWLGTGLLTATGDKWRQRRRIIAPSFHLQLLERFVDVFESNGDILVKKLEKEIEKPVDIFPYISLCTLDVICESIMGTTVNAQNNSDSRYVQCVKETCRILVGRAFSAIKVNDFLYRFTPDYYKERKMVKFMNTYINSVIRSRRDELESQSGDADAQAEDKRKKSPLLDSLLKVKVDGQSLTFKDLNEEVNTFMFAGHDTTTSAISFALYCLAKHQDIQNKVLEELLSIFSDDTRSATYEDLQEMKYLELVIKETLRLFPPVPFYSREMEEDVKYEEHILPKDLTLCIFAYGVHRDPRIWPEPEKFDPERFSPENSTGRSPYAYIPFSAGPRNCIGQKFALLETKSVISNIIRNFEVHLANPDVEPILSAETTLKSANGIVLNLKKRVHK